MPACSTARFISELLRRGSSSPHRGAPFFLCCTRASVLDISNLLGFSAYLSTLSFFLGIVNTRRPAAIGPIFEKNLE